MPPKKTTKRSNAPSSLVDKGLKARWTEAIARFRDATQSETVGWDERYEALGEILHSDPPYYLAGGYATARAFLAKEAPGLDERTVRTYVRVARYFDPEDEARHGISKLEALLAYLEARGGGPLAPAKIHLERQKVRVPDGKTTRLRPFAEVTVAELRTATRAARRAPAPSEPPLLKWLRAHLRKAKLGAISVRLRHKKLDLGGIRPDDVPRLGSALAKAKLPADE